MHALASVTPALSTSHYVSCRVLPMHQYMPAQACLKGEFWDVPRIVSAVRYQPPATRLQVFRSVQHRRRFT
jgi:hypothetical protein